jgi:dihydroneopterin aldolase
MHFYAHHGFFDEEQKIGNEFLVTITINLDLDSPQLTDNLEDTLNYQTIYDATNEQMQIKSRLLENVAQRILNAVKTLHPKIKKTEVRLTKINPPLGGHVERVEIQLCE